MNPPRKRVGTTNWTEEQIRWLKMHYESLSDADLSKKLGRSESAVYLKRTQLGLVRMNLAGFTTLKKLVDETGYSRRQLAGAKKALSQTWQRCKPGPGAKALRFNISYEQADALVNFLAKQWGPASLKLTGCIRCERSDRPHKGRGLCKVCFVTEQRKARRGQPSLLDTAPVALPERVYRASIAPEKAA